MVENVLINSSQLRKCIICHVCVLKNTFVMRAYLTVLSTSRKHPGMEQKSCLWKQQTWISFFSAVSLYENKEEVA